MSRDYGVVISVRLPIQMVQKMEDAIDTGMYRNRADYIMAALRQFNDGINPHTGGGRQIPIKGLAPRLII